MIVEGHVQDVGVQVALIHHVHPDRLAVDLHRHLPHLLPVLVEDVLDVVLDVLLLGAGRLLLPGLRHELPLHGLLGGDLARARLLLRGHHAELRRVLRPGHGLAPLHGLLRAVAELLLLLGRVAVLLLLLLLLLLVIQPNCK